MRGRCKTRYLIWIIVVRRRVGRRYCWQDVSYQEAHWTPKMEGTQRAGLMQRWHVVQAELIPDLGQEVGGLTPRLEKLIHTLEWVTVCRRHLDATPC